MLDFINRLEVQLNIWLISHFRLRINKIFRIHAWLMILFSTTIHFIPILKLKFLPIPNLLSSLNIINNTFSHFPRIINQKLFPSLTSRWKIDLQNPWLIILVNYDIKAKYLKAFTFVLDFVLTIFKTDNNLLFYLLFYCLPFTRPWFWVYFLL